MEKKKQGRPGNPHSPSHHPLNATWQMMRQRCQNPRATAYKFYGGRGIKVCEEWDTNFWAFACQMGPKPTPLHTIDRIDPDGDYEPGNCRWASPQEQRANQRPASRRAAKTRYIWNGEVRHLTDLAEEHGIKVATVRARLKHKGMTLEEALTTPARVYKRQS